MKLNPELAQEIIDYTAGIVKYVVNIMDTDAVIIASTDQNRIGEVHGGAKRVLSTGEPFTTDLKFSENHPGYVPGINLPIKFMGDMIGVLGIGAGEESRLIGGILLSTTELLIEQSYLSNKLSIEKQVRTEFLSHLLTESWHENEKYFKRQLDLHSFDINESNLVVVVEIPENFFNQAPLSPETSSADTKIVRYERLLNSVTERIAALMSPYHPNVLMQPGQLVLLLSCDVNRLEDTNLYLPDYIFCLEKAMESLIGQNFRIGIGGFAKDMTAVHKYYKHAIYALKISNILMPDERISSFRSFYTEYEFLGLPKYKREHFYKAVLGELLSSENSLWLETLDVFFKNDKSIADTAEKLYIHRNTLMFRLHKIEKLTGLNPQSFKDSITLNSAVTLWKLKDFEESSDTLLI